MCHLEELVSAAAFVVASAAYVENEVVLHVGIFVAVVGIAGIVVVFYYFATNKQTNLPGM